MEQNFQGAYFSLGKVIFSIFIENVIYRNNELVDIQKWDEKKWSEESGSQS